MENERTLCPACGAEMQEFRGQYFCLDCGNEYRMETDDSGNSKIVLTSGNPLRDKVQVDDEEPEAIPEQEPEEPQPEYQSREVYTPEYEQRNNENKIRSLLIGVLVFVIVLTAIILSVIFLNSCEKDPYNSDNISISSDEKTSDDSVSEKPLETESPKATDEPGETEEPKEEEPTENPVATPMETEKPTEEKPEATEGTTVSEPLYRVRKSRDDAATQLSAYRNLDSAKKDADANKADGYKVYDQDGNLVYTP